MNRLLPILIAVLLSFPVFAEDADMVIRFAQAGCNGTFVLESLRTGQSFIHDEDRAGQRFSPASTFKVFNTLIALQAGAVTGADDRFVWDGQHYSIAAWNHDQTLASAFRVSCVWCYQQLARRVGPETYRQAIRQAGYGTLSEPFELTEFWLDGSLQISALEQVAFLRKVVLRTLPFRPQSLDTLREIMRVEQTPHWTLRAKTGWAARSTPGIGWYVGVVETRDDVWLFAMNLDLENAEDLPLRISLTRAILRDKGVID